MLQQLKFGSIHVTIDNLFSFSVKIKPQFSLLNDAHQTAEVLLSQKQNLTEDTWLMRFEFRNPNLCLGTQIGQYITIKDLQFSKDIEKAYAPISRIDDAGYFDLLVKQIPQSNDNSKPFSSHLIKSDVAHKNNQILKLGYKFLIRGPLTSFIYNGKGEFLLNKLGSQGTSRSGKNEEMVKVKKRFIGLISEGTAISAFFQLIEGIATNGDNTQVSLFQVLNNAKDLCLMEEILWLVQEQKIQAQFLLKDMSNKSWPSFKGELSAGILQDYMPPPNIDESLIMICGSQQFKGQVHYILKQLQYPDDCICFI